MRRLLALGLLVLFAGCSDRAPAGPEDDAFSGLPDQPTAHGKGIIRGVVFDGALVPIEGASVHLQGGAETATVAGGAFVLNDVEPGLHFLTVGKVGYSTVQQSVEVTAGVKDPPAVKVRLERLPGTEPRAETTSADGFIACGIGTPLTFHVCPGLSEDRSTVLLPFLGTPSVVQTETMWESTQALGEQLYLLYYFCTDNCDARGDRWDQGNRDTPWIARTDGQNRTDMQVAVYASPGGPANGTGVAFDQPFTVFSTVFYNIAEPDPSWTFIEHGEYPV